ncbi:MAG: hypothetical protein AAFV95_07220 [Bacteroidota bacterium]
MASPKKKIDQFKEWQLSRDQMYQYKGKANAHFVVNGVVFHNSASQQASHVLRQLEPVAETPDLPSVGFSSGGWLRRARQRVSGWFK